MELTTEHYRIAKIAYDAYVKESGGVSLVSGNKLPEFEEQPRQIKDAWAAAAMAVAYDRVIEMLALRKKCCGLVSANTFCELHRGHDGPCQGHN